MLTVREIRNALAGLLDDDPVELGVVGLSGAMETAYYTSLLDPFPSAEARLTGVRRNHSTLIIEVEVELTEEEASD